MIGRARSKRKVSDMADDTTGKVSEPEADPEVDGVGPVAEEETEVLEPAEEMGDDIGEPNARPEVWEATSNE